MFAFNTLTLTQPLVNIQQSYETFLARFNSIVIFNISIEQIKQIIISLFNEEIYYYTA